MASENASSMSVKPASPGSLTFRVRPDAPTPSPSKRSFRRRWTRRSPQERAFGDLLISTRTENLRASAHCKSESTHFKLSRSAYFYGRWPPSDSPGRLLSISIHPMGADDNGTCVLGGSLSSLWSAPETRGMAMAARTAASTATTINSTREDPRAEVRQGNVVPRRISPPKLGRHLTNCYPIRRSSIHRQSSVWQGCRLGSSVYLKG